MNKKEVKRSIFSYVFVIAILICLYYVFVSFRSVNNKLTYDEFINNLNNGTIEKLEMTPSSSGQVYNLVGKLKGYKENEVFSLKAPLSEKVVSDILNASEEGNFEIVVNKEPPLYADGYWNGQKIPTGDEPLTEEDIKIQKKLEEIINSFR